VVATWEDLREACAPALADLERSRPGVLRPGSAPGSAPAVDPWGNDVSSLWLWEAQGGSGTGIWLGDPDEQPWEAVLRATETVQDAAIDAVWGAWPECPDHPDSHPLTPDLAEEVAVWTCPATRRRVSKVGEFGVHPG
jgi:hypothetical protein